MTLSRSDYYPWTYYVFFVNDDVIITHQCLWHKMSFSHRASETAQLLKQMTPDFIPPTLWPPNNSDLNTVDYAVWGIMQERVYKKMVNCVNRLWRNGNNSASMWLIMWSDKWRRRLRGCVNADGGQFEQFLWLTFWLPQWTSLSFIKCLTILYRLHCYLFSVVFASAD